MRSIGSRLALWYALSSTATLTLIVVAGYYLLTTHLVTSLDKLNRREFQQMRTALRADFAILEPEGMAERLRVATEASSIPLFVEAHLRGLGPVFASDNLEGKQIPDSLPQAEFNASLEGVGELRVGRFEMGRMTVFVATSLEDAKRVTTAYLEVSGLLVAVAAAVSCGLGLWLSRVALRPVRVIQRTAEHIGSDNLSERIPVGEVDDEISNLARLLNRTFDRLEAAFNQVRRFTAEASHELKTPLALARAQGEKLLRDRAVAPGSEETVQNLLEEIAQLEKIIEELLLLSRAESHAIPLELSTLDAQQFMRHFAQDARMLGEYRGVFIEDSYEGEGNAEFDPKWMRQVFFNLMTNALRLSVRGGTVSIVSTVGEDGWRVAIEDDGPGVPADQVERIFERFFRIPHSDDDDKGSGLGLAISRSIITLHRGKIRAELPTKGRGLRVVVELPVVDAGSPRVVVDGTSLLRAREITS
jgi:signal transduction histidine kinase